MAAYVPSPVGIAHRRLTSSLAAPAMCAITPSNTCRFCSSVLNPSYKKLRRNRPLCDDPKPYAYRTGASASAWCFNHVVVSRIATKPRPATGGFAAR